MKDGKKSMRGITTTEWLLTSVWVLFCWFVVPHIMTIFFGDDQEISYGTSVAFMSGGLLVVYLVFYIIRTLKIRRANVTNTTRK